MQTVLTKTLIGIAISILINAIIYTSVANPQYKALILSNGAVTFFSTIPFILSYILSYFLNQRYNPFLYTLNVLIFLINTLLVFSAPILILYAASIFLLLIFNFSYVIPMFYIFYHTVQDPNNTLKKINIPSEDILDDTL